MSIGANLAENKNKNCSNPRSDPHLALQLPFNFFIYQVAGPRGSTAALLTSFLLSCNQPSVDVSPSMALSGRHKHMKPKVNPSRECPLQPFRPLTGSVDPETSHQCWNHMEDKDRQPMTQCPLVFCQFRPLDNWRS